MYFDFVLCSVLPNLFSFDSHLKVVRSFMPKAFGGEEIIQNKAENGQCVPELSPDRVS